MRKILAIMIGVAFAFSTAGYAVAQAPPTTPAAPKADEKKADDKKADKMDKKMEKKDKKADKMDKKMEKKDKKMDKKADKKGTEDTKAPATEKK